MFKDTAADKALKIAGMVAAAVVVIWFVAAAQRRHSENAAIEAALRELENAQNAVATRLVHESVNMMQPVQKAAEDAFTTMAANANARSAQIKAKAAADREAARKKIFRWTDKNGTPHISDAPPPADATNITQIN